MAEQVGLVAVLDLSTFNRNYKSYIRSLNSMNTMTGSTASSLSGQFLGLGNSLLKLATILSVTVVAAATAATVAMGKFVVDSIKQAKDMQSQISDIAAVLNMTNEEAQIFKGTILELGLDPTLKVTAQESADVIEVLARQGVFAGMSFEQMEQASLDLGKSVILLANATGADFTTAANIASDAMIMWNMNASDMLGIVSSITSVTTNSRFRIEDYELALRNSGATAAEAGVSFEDFNTAIAATAEEMGTGQKAGTGFRNFIARLTPNSEKAADAMRDLGLITADGKNIFFDASGSLKDMNEISQILWNSLQEGQVVTQEIGGRTAEQNALLADAKTKYQEAAATIAEYTTGVTGILASEEERNAVIAEQQAIMDKLSPTIQELEGITGDYVSTLSHLTDEQRFVALETIFGQDALQSAIGIMKEGETIVSDVARVMDALAISEEEAFALVSSGITEFELLQKTMARTDAQANAETRMDNLAGKMEILDGIMETLQLRIGDAFIPLLTDVAEAVLSWIEANDGLLENIGGVADSVAGFFTDLWDGKPALESFRDMLGEIGGEGLTEQFDKITEAISNFITPIIEFVNEHSEALITALKLIGGAFAGLMIISAVAGLLSLIISPLGAIVGLATLIGFAWEENWGGIQEIVATTKETVLDFLDSVGILDAFDLGGIKGVWEQLPDAIEKTIAKINTAISNIDIGKLAYQIFGFFGKLKGMTPREILLAFDSLRDKFNAIKEALKPVGDLFTAYYNTIVPSFQKAWENVISASSSFSGVWEQIKETASALAPILEAIGAIIAGAFAVSMGLMAGIIEGVATSIDSLILGFSYMIQGFLQVVEGIADVLVGLWDVIVGIFTLNTDKIKEGFSKMGDGLLDILVGAFTAIFGLIAGTLTTVLEFIYGFVAGVIEYFTNLYNELVGHSIIPDMVNGILDWILNMTTLFLDYITTMVILVLAKFGMFIIEMILKAIRLKDKVIEKATEMWDKFITLVKDKTKEIIEKVTTFIQDMIQLFTDKISEFKTAGEDIIQGLINGILAKLEAAKAAALGVASALKDAWDDFWNSNSPSKVMIESGQDIMEGANIGVQKKGDALIRSMETIGTVALDGFLNRVSNILPAGSAPQSINNNSQVVNNFEVNNSFAGSPQVTDASQLQLILAGYR